MLITARGMFLHSLQNYIVVSKWRLTYYHKPFPIMKWAAGHHFLKVNSILIGVYTGWMVPMRSFLSGNLIILIPMKMLVLPNILELNMGLLTNLGKIFSFVLVVLMQDIH